MNGYRGSRRGLVVFAVLLSATALAEYRSGERVVVAEDEVVEGDLYATAERVEVRGLVQGDLIAGAQTVLIEGEVRGDVLAAAAVLSVPGQVGGSVRGFAGQVQLSGEVGEDLAVAAGQLSLRPEARIGRDLFGAGGQLELDAPVVGSARLAGGTGRLGGAFAGDVTAYLGELSVSDSAKIAGTLRYASEQPVQIASGAQIGARAEVPVPEGSSQQMPWALRWLRGVFAFTVFGLLLALVAPRLANRAPNTLQARPFQSLGAGVLAMAVIPPAVILTIVVGALLGGWWLGLVLLAAAGILTAAAIPIVSFAIGRGLVTRWRPNLHPSLMLLLGVALVALLISIPFAGPALALIAIAFGVGTVLITAFTGRPPRSELTRGLQTPTRPQVPAGGAVVGAGS